MTTRAASHAGSWYTASSSSLSRELDGWLGEVGKNREGKTSEARENEAVVYPVPGARVIIAP